MGIGRKIGYVVSVFNNGGMVQLEQDWTIPAAIGVGLYQGLKYNGSFKRGVKAGGLTVGVLYTGNGLYNLVINRKIISENLKQMED